MSLPYGDDPYAFVLEGGSERSFLPDRDDGVFESFIEQGEHPQQRHLAAAYLERDDELDNFFLRFHIFRCR